MLKYTEWCCNKQISSLFNDIKYLDYFEPIKRYSKLNENIFAKIINKNKINDMVMNYYIKSRTDIHIIILYPNALKHNNAYKKCIKILETFGDIHYIKKHKLNYTTSYNMIYQLYAHQNYMKTNYDIIHKINRIGFSNIDKLFDIEVIIYTLTNKNNSIFDLKAFIYIYI